MASINLSGILVDSLGEVDVGAVITWTHLSNTGETIATTKVDTIIPPDGAYDIDLEFGRIRIDYRTRNTERFIAEVIVDGDSTATTIPQLLSASVPVKEDVIIEMESILGDTVTAQNAAEDAQIAAEAAAQAAEDFSTTLPDADVILPLGNKITDRLSGHFEFFRGSTTGNINKSAINKLLLIDEPAVTSDGLSSYEGYDNEQVGSEELSVLQQLGCTTTDNDSSVGVVSLSETTADASTGVHELRYSVLFTDAEVFSISMTVKSIDLRYFSMKIVLGGGAKVAVFDLQDGVIESSNTNFTNVKIKKMSQVDTYLCSLSIAAVGSGSSTFRYQMREVPGSDSFTNNGARIQWGGAQVTRTQDIRPYMKTTASLVATREKDIAIIPVENNIPLDGSGWTIIVDCSVPINTNEDSGVFSAEQSSDYFLLRRSVSSTKLDVRIKDGSESDLSFVSTVDVDDLKHRFALVFTGTLVTLYVDGVANGNVLCDGFTLEQDGSLFLGSLFNSTSHLNSELSNFKIYHRPLSQAELTYIGSAE